MSSEIKTVLSDPQPLWPESVLPEPHSILDRQYLRQHLRQTISQTAYRLFPWHHRQVCTISSLNLSYLCCSRPVRTIPLGSQERPLLDLLTPSTPSLSPSRRGGSLPQSSRVVSRQSRRRSEAEPLLCIIMALWTHSILGHTLLSLLLKHLHMHLGGVSRGLPRPLRQLGGQLGLAPPPGHLPTTQGGPLLLCP